jgi:cyclopropane fatty-acyl-phospholipid synthase-like methyltransferase
MERLQMLGGYASLFRDFRHEDFAGFVERHDRLYADARRTGDYTAVTRAYYAFMGRIISVAYGADCHFCPPEHPEQSRVEATRALHDRLALHASLGRETHGLDVGSGAGGAMLDLAARRGVQMTGITLVDDEVAQCNEAAKRLGLEHRCRAIVGDARSMPVDDGSFDGGYAVYALKYFDRLEPVFAEIARALRPGARFVVYDIVKTNRFDGENPAHTRVVSGFEYACGMPDLHTVEQIADAAKPHGLVERARADLSEHYPWYYFFETTPLLPWLVGSPTVRRMVRGLERLRLLPTGFAEFNDTFASGTVHALLEGGRAGIISGSAMLVLEKR